MNESGMNDSTERHGFKAMPSEGQLLVGAMWFFCGALVVCFGIAVFLLAQELAGDGDPGYVSKSGGLAAIFAALAVFHALVARLLPRRSRLAWYAAVAVEGCAVALCLYSSASPFIDGFDADSLEVIGGGCFGVLIYGVILVSACSKEMRQWCDRRPRPYWRKGRTHELAR